jgi:hypothetical protein
VEQAETSVRRRFSVARANHFSPISMMWGAGIKAQWRQKHKSVVEEITDFEKYEIPGIASPSMAANHFSV